MSPVLGWVLCFCEFWSWMSLVLGWVIPLPLNLAQLWRSSSRTVLYGGDWLVIKLQLGFIYLCITRGSWWADTANVVCCVWPVFSWASVGHGCLLRILDVKILRCDDKQEHLSLRYKKCQTILMHYYARSLHRPWPLLGNSAYSCYLRWPYEPTILMHASRDSSKIIMLPRHHLLYYVCHQKMYLSVFDNLVSKFPWSRHWFKIASANLSDGFTNKSYSHPN